MDLEGLDLGTAGGSTRLLLRVKPAARKDAIVGVHGSRLKMTVAAPPERGAANDAVRRLIAGALDWPLARVRLVAGPASRDKAVLVEGCAPEEVRRRLERLP